MTYKMIVSDLDGTLLRSDHLTVSKVTKEELHRVCRRGVRFVPASGRQPSAIRLIMNDIGLKTPVVGFSGAIIRDENDATVWERGLTKRQALEIRALLKKEYPALTVSTYGGDLWIVDDASSPESVYEASVLKEQPVEGDPEKLLPENACVHKVLCVGDPKALDAVAERLKPIYPACRIYKSQATYLEIMSGEASKSAAAAVLCRLYGLSPEETIAFGDNYNDADLIEFAGLGVAAGNAPADIRAIADLVADTNDNDGVAKVLREKIV